MKVILIDRRLEASRVITLGRWSRAVLSMCCLGLPLSLVGIGYFIGKFAEVPEVLAPLQDEVDAQAAAATSTGRGLGPTPARAAAPVTRVIRVSGE